MQKSNIPTPTETGLKVIAFDQGGIYISVDYNATIQAFRALGATNPESIYTQALQTETIDMLERGQCSKQDFCCYLKENLLGLPANISDASLCDAWSAIITGVIPGILEFIKKLRSLGYITIMVSNTNVIHQKTILDYLKAANALDLLNNEAFDKTYTSYQFGLNKPYIDIFNAVIKDLNCIFPQKHIKPSEILFVDDSKKHIIGRNTNEGAENAGWQGLLVESNLSLSAFAESIISALETLKERYKCATLA
jgi:glucose-1-phosphatase